MRILSFKCLLDPWKAKVGVALGISPDLEKIKQLGICSKHQNSLHTTLYERILKMHALIGLTKQISA